ncbi:uncharacterized protein LOC144518876 [Sander vitreus]
MTVTMAEEEVNYASVVFKSNKHPPTQGKFSKSFSDSQQEFCSTRKQTTDVAHISGWPVVWGFFVSFCFTSVISENDSKLTAEIQQLETLMQHLNLSKDNVTLLAAIQHLTNHNDKLSSDNEKLRRDYDDLTTQNQQLETQRNNLTEQIQDMKTNWNKLNVSRAQWSIDAYCPKGNKMRQCKACLNGWDLSRSNCYVYHNPDPPHRKTWEEAREDCRGKSSDLVVHSQEEKVMRNGNFYDTIIKLKCIFCI